MIRVLVTGMSGTGKSTVLAELARRGHRVIDTDEGEWAHDVPVAGSPGAAGSGIEGVAVERLWREERIATLLAEGGAGCLFVAGCVRNQGKFYDRFDAVVLLSAPVEVMLQRLSTRTNNPFGKSSVERERILQDLDEVEPLLRKTCTVEIVTDRPVGEVAAAIQGIALGER